MLAKRRRRTALLVRSAIGEGRIGRGCVGRVRAATIATHRLTKAVEKPRELGAATARGDLSVLLLVGRGARQLLSEPHVFGRHADEDDGENDGDERGPGLHHGGRPLDGSAVHVEPCEKGAHLSASPPRWQRIRTMRGARVSGTRPGTRRRVARDRAAASLGNHKCRDWESNPDALSGNGF